MVVVEMEDGEAETEAETEVDTDSEAELGPTGWWLVCVLEEETSDALLETDGGSFEAWSATSMLVVVVVVVVVIPPVVVVASEKEEAVVVLFDATVLAGGLAAVTAAMAKALFVGLTHGLEDGSLADAELRAASEAGRQGPGLGTARGGSWAEEGEGAGGAALVEDICLNLRCL
ncbi:hypothetical protein BGZ94_005528 [Podila epigama]|nr:hypothetical protein BGZ94_005528 [Podila epigama]